MSRNIIFILMYRRHKPLELILHVVELRSVTVVVCQSVVRLNFVGRMECPATCQTKYLVVTDDIDPH
jgi:hypothetical protein